MHIFSKLSWGRWAFGRILNGINKKMLHLHAIYLNESKKNVKNGKEENKKEDKKDVQIVTNYTVYGYATTL